MNEVVNAGAARTPVGACSGGLSSLAADDLDEIAIKGALKRAGASPDDVSEVIMGQILAAGIPQKKTAYGINQLCGSGLRTVALGYQAIQCGDSDIVVTGGHESMSQAPHVTHLHKCTMMDSAEMVDSMIKDRPWDAFNGYHMGIAMCVLRD